MTEADFNWSLKKQFSTDAKWSMRVIVWSQDSTAEVVRNPMACDKNIRFYVKKHRLQLLDLLSLAMNDALPQRSGKHLYTMGGPQSSKWSLLCMYMYVHVWHVYESYLPFLQNVQDSSLMGSSAALFWGLLQDHQGGLWQWTTSYWLPQDIHVWEGMYTCKFNCLSKECVTVHDCFWFWVCTLKFQGV